VLAVLFLVRLFDWAQKRAAKRARAAT